VGSARQGPRGGLRLRTNFVPDLCLRAMPQARGRDWGLARPLRKVRSRRVVRKARLIDLFFLLSTRTNSRPAAVNLTSFG
jgi:hypothetical protein